jgi:aerobic-type carbon monoxide dehydrogenase small subunit (CoxS/CutS family)
LTVSARSSRSKVSRTLNRIRFTAFTEQQAVQYGYYINDTIMQSVPLLVRNPKPSEGEVKVELANNLRCGCGTHLAADSRKGPQGHR